MARGLSTPGNAPDRASAGRQWHSTKVIGLVAHQHAEGNSGSSCKHDDRNDGPEAYWVICASDDHLSAPRIHLSLGGGVPSYGPED